MLIFFAAVIGIIHFKTMNLQPDYSEDHGFGLRLYSLCFMGAAFYFFMSRKDRVVGMIIGFFLAILLSLLGYIIASLFPVYGPALGLLFHIVTASAILALFFFLEKKFWNDGPSNSNAQA